MDIYRDKRIAARKILLNRLDILSFHHVPDFIVDAFFGSCTYKNRLIVSTFAYLNGVQFSQLLSLVRWRDIKETEKLKIKGLYDDFEKPSYRLKYYSYHINEKLVMYLNGDIRKWGKRIPRLNNQKY